MRPPRPRLALALSASLLLGGLAGPAVASPACSADPLGGRALYLRGSFNAWAAPDAQRFTWACDRYELVTRLQGEHRFKIGDEGWSRDADFGAAGPGATPPTLRLQAQGAELSGRFNGPYRFTLKMKNPLAPELQLQRCPLDEPPLGATVLFLRGTLNNWAALEDFQFTFSCDAYYLNLKAEGRHEFKIADSAWSDAATIGPQGIAGIAGRNSANFSAPFDGEHTLRLAWAGGRPQLDIGPRTWADPRTAPVTDPVALSLAFDSRSAEHKTPFGALPAGSEVRFAITALPGVERATLVVERRRLEGNQEVLEYTEVARLPMQRAMEPADAAAGRERFSARHRFDTTAVYGYWFELQIGGKLFVFQNNATPLHWTREKGTGGQGTVADKPAHHGGIRRFRQTIHAPGLQVPAWAADVVYYYVFPERFRNGNKANDPLPGSAKYRDKGIEKHPQWIGRPYKPGSGDGSDEVFNNDFFGGDLQGLIDKLPWIRALGANTIYSTPMFRAGSNHKYDHADYLNIDPAFGDNALFERLTREAAAQGMRVIPDASLNHTGSDSIYFDRYGNFGSHGAFAGGKPNPASPYFNWYRFDLKQTNPDRQYRGWVGVTDLPELDKTSPGWRDFAYRRPDSVTRTWLKRGASGWRMDVAPWVPDDFWREWRRAVKETRPDALTVAEAWFDASKYFLGDMFDSTMNYVFRNAVQDFALGGPAAALAAQLEHLREATPEPVHQALMNLLSSHDQARALHVFGYTEGTTLPAAIDRAKARLKLAVLLQMTYPGAPTVYYGDEVGLTGGDDPYNRAPFPWPDEGGQPDLNLFAAYQQLIALRHAHPVLRRGSLQAPVVVGKHVIAWTRRLDDTTALVLLNNAEQPQTVRLPLPPGTQLEGWRDALNAGSMGAEAGTLVIELPPLFGRVLVHEAGAR